MKKKVSISIESHIWDFMEKNFTNKSKLIETLIKKYYTERGINLEKYTERGINLEKERAQIDKEMDGVFDGAY